MCVSGSDSYVLRFLLYIESPESYAKSDHVLQTWSQGQGLVVQGEGQRQWQI